MRIDSAGLPFIGIATVPVAVSAWLGPAWLTALLVTLPVAVALFFRDPERQAPATSTGVLAPADGTVMYAGSARPEEAPPGQWQQISIFLSLLDVHINRTPVTGRVTRADYHPGRFLPAYRADAWKNEHSEIWLDAGGRTIVVRQIVGVLARRVVCRVKAGDALTAGDRIGLMKFGSRMDVFMPIDAAVLVEKGRQVRGGETVVAQLPAGSA